MTKRTNWLGVTFDRLNWLSRVVSHTGQQKIPANIVRVGRPRDGLGDRQTFSSGTFSFWTFSYRTFSFLDIQLYGTFSFLDIQLLGHSAFGTSSFWDIQLPDIQLYWTSSFWDIQLLGHSAFGTFSFWDIQLLGHPALWDFFIRNSFELEKFWTGKNLNWNSFGHRNYDMKNYDMGIVTWKIMEHFWTFWTFEHFWIMCQLNKYLCIGYNMPNLGGWV